MHLLVRHPARENLQGLLGDVVTHVLVVEVAEDPASGLADRFVSVVKLGPQQG